LIDRESYSRDTGADVITPAQLDATSDAETPECATSADCDDEIECTSETCTNGKCVRGEVTGGLTPQQAITLCSTP
jgi:hypothetical protein